MKRLSTVLKAVPTVSNMQSNSGNDVPNQYEIETNEGTFFKSYKTIIAAKLNDGRIILDERNHDYSNTTTRYRNQFLGMDSKEVKKAIANGSIILENLN